MHNKVVYRMARGLRRAGAVVLRFNYRGVNLSEGSYDEGEGEIEDARAALALPARALSGSAVHAGRIFVRLAHRAEAGLRDTGVSAIVRGGLSRQVPRNIQAAASAKCRAFTSEHERRIRVRCRKCRRISIRSAGRRSWFG